MEKLIDKRDEYLKCATNPKYFLNNYGYIFDADLNSIGLMNCFKYQEKCVDKFHKFRNNIVLKSRQTGLSVITAGYVAWRLIFRKDEKILIIANDGTGAVRFLTTVKQFIDYTPKWLLPGNGERLISNQKKVQLENNSWAEAKASSQNAGRGDSLTMLVLDETAFIEYAREIWTAAGLALSRTNGKCIMISTPNGRGNLFHSTWENAESNKSPDKNDFVTTRVHWTENPFCAKGIELRTNEKGERVYWSPWYEGESKRLEYDRVKIAQELDLSFEGSKYLAVESDLTAKYEKRFLLDEYINIEKNMTYYDYKQPQGERFVNYVTNFHIFKKYIKGSNYIISADVARGDGTDFSAIQIIDVEKLEVVAEYREKISPDLLAQVLYCIAIDYGEAYVVIEANSFGLGTAFDLNRKMNYKKMYFSKSVQDIYVRPYDYKVAEDETIPGFQTSKKTRPLVIGNLMSHMREGALKFYSKRLMSEFRTFIQKGDRPEAEKGKNDDLIFALAIGLFIRDTEYSNAVTTKEMYKGMLDAFGYSTGNIKGKNYTSSEKIEEKNIEIPPLAGGIFVADEIKQCDTNDNDLGWLLR